MHEACSGAFFEVCGSLIWFWSLCRGCRACQPLWWSDRPLLSSSPAPAVHRLNAPLHAHWRPYYGAERSGISCASTLQVTGRGGTGVRMKRVHNYAENKNYLVPSSPPSPNPIPNNYFWWEGKETGSIEIKTVVVFFFFLGNRALISICATSSWASVIGWDLLLIWWWLAEACRDRKWQCGSHSPTLGEMWGTIHTPTAVSRTQRLCVFMLVCVYMLVEVISCLPPCLSVCLPPPNLSICLIVKIYCCLHDVGVALRNINNRMEFGVNIYHIYQYLVSD